MGLCSDCSKAEGVVRVGPLTICPTCAEARIRSLEAVAEERARDWQRERIRAEKLAEKLPHVEKDVQKLRGELVIVEILNSRLVEREAQVARLQAVATDMRHTLRAYMQEDVEAERRTLLRLNETIGTLQPGDLPLWDKAQEDSDGAPT